MSVLSGKNEGWSRVDEVTPIFNIVAWSDKLDVHEIASFSSFKECIRAVRTYEHLAELFDIGVNAKFQVQCGELAANTDGTGLLWESHLCHT